MTWQGWRRESGDALRAAVSIVKVLWRLNNLLGPAAWIITIVGSLLISLLTKSAAWGAFALAVFLLFLAFLEVCRRERSGNSGGTSEVATNVFHVQGDLNVYMGGSGAAGGGGNVSVEVSNERNIEDETP